MPYVIVKECVTDGELSNEYADSLYYLEIRTEDQGILNFSRYLV